MTLPKSVELFDANYYASGCGLAYRREARWLQFFGAIADRMIQDIQFKTVLDAGCAMGFLVEALRDRGVAAFGVDISEYAIQQVRQDIQPFCWQGSVTKPFPQRYDLIVCMEVLEHLPQAESEQAIKILCQHTDDILFSSTPFDYKEVTHFNVQPPEYWAEQFARHGFFRDVDFDASFILPWAVRFRRRMEPSHRIIREYERKFWLLSKENSDLRHLTLEMRQELAQFSDKEPYSELLADLEWTKTQIWRISNQNWADRLQYGLKKLNYLGIVGQRPARRLPSLGRPLTQTFVAEYNNLNSLTVLLERDLSAVTHSLEVALVQADLPDQPILKQSVSPRHLPEIGPFTLRFPPLPASQQQTYRLTFHLPSGAAGQALYLWGYLQPGRLKSELYWGEQRLPAELVLSASYGPPENSFYDLWNLVCWVPRSILNPSALLDSIRALLANKRA